MSKPGTHPCPIIGCRCHNVSSQFLMCRSHWFSVPKKLKDLIYETVFDLDRSDEYRRAVREAITIVHQRKGFATTQIENRLKELGR